MWDEPKPVKKFKADTSQFVDPHDFSQSQQLLVVNSRSFRYLSEHGQNSDFETLNYQQKFDLLPIRLKMDSESLTSRFFSWVDTNEDDYPFPIIFGDAHDGGLSFTLSDFNVKLNLSDWEISCPNARGFASDWLELQEVYMQDNAEEIITGQRSLDTILKDIIDSFQEFQENGEGSDDEEWGEEVAEDDDYRMDIIDAEKTEAIAEARKTGQTSSLLAELSETFTQHFICREATEAKALLDRTIEMNPHLKYTSNISIHPEISLIKLEIDLSFLDISQESMTMLGLNFEDLLCINISINENRLMQSQDEVEWSPALVGAMTMEVAQAGRIESYGCQQYVLGRVNKYKEEFHRKLIEGEDILSLLSLERNSSVMKEEGKTQKRGPQGNRGKPTSTLNPPVDPNMLDTLVGMGFIQYEAAHVLETNGNNLEQAIEVLTSGALNIPPPTQGDSELITTGNFFYNLVFYLRERLQNMTSYCYICYDRHISDSIRLRPCCKDMCEFRFEEVSGMSVYAEMTSNYNQVLLDLSYAAEAAFSQRASAVFEPFPSFLLKNHQLRGKAGFLTDLDKGGKGYDKSQDEANKDVPKLRELFTIMPAVREILDSSVNEETLRQFLLDRNGLDQGQLLYKLLRYIIATNRLACLQLNGNQIIADIPENIKQFVVVNHSPEKEKWFQSEKDRLGSLYVFHGSAIENWYSIIRNGIRNLSNTHMMTAGAAYGPGVYSATQMQTSSSYCHSRTGSTGGKWNFSMLQNPPHSCMGIIEVIKNGYEKGNGFCVIPNDKHIMIRYLLLVPNQGYGNVDSSKLPLEKHNKDVLGAIERKDAQEKQLRVSQAIERNRKRAEQEKQAQILLEKEMEARRAAKAREDEENKFDPALEKKIETMEQKFVGQGSSATNKRILQEYKYLSQSKECKGLTVEFDGGDNMYVWQATLDVFAFDIEGKMRDDFTKLRDQHNQRAAIQFEIRFDANFPFNPPFIRIVKPRFGFHTGHVTIGGSICMQSLTPSGWIPVRTVESVFIEILFNMQEGGAQLDFGQVGREYSMSEAQEAFNRVAKHHGWV